MDIKQVEQLINEHRIEVVRVGGADMADAGAVPDIIVPQTPEAESRNDDQQLRAALDDLLTRLN